MAKDTTFPVSRARITEIRMAWTEERVELLKKLWAEGLSASQIARTMGEVTRNAVIGKVHRLGLSGRATTGRSNRPRRAALPKPMPKPVVAEPEVIEEATLDNGDFATVMTLSSTMCRWPIGDPGSSDFHFCGNSTEAGSPYCEAHVRQAYQPAQSRRDRRRASG
jgi:GcrA cell cycle regulator